MFIYFLIYTSLYTQILRKLHILLPSIMSYLRSLFLFYAGGILGEAAQNVSIRKRLDLGDKECTFDPMEGFSFVNLFSFHCDYPEQLSGFPLKFEVYQTPDPSHPETGEISHHDTLKPFIVSSFSSCLLFYFHTSLLLFYLPLSLLFSSLFSSHLLNKTPKSVCL